MKKSNIRAITIFNKTSLFPVTVAVMSCNISEPIFFIKEAEKNVAKENMRDRLGHEIFPGERYLKGFYQQKSRSKNISIKKFSILSYDLCLTPEKIFDLFVEISNDPTMNGNAQLKLLEKPCKNVIF